LIADVNLHVSRWPFRRLPLDETPALVKKLQSLGVSQAWACSFDAILHRDVAGVNARLVADCRRNGGGVLVPFGALNLALPDWGEDFRRCREVFHMPGVRLYPNYHGYKLADPTFAKLLEMSVAANMIVQIAVSMEDERTQHPLVRVPPVELDSLPNLMKKFPTAKAILLNALRAPHSSALSLLTKTPNLSFDMATLENVGGVSLVVEQIGAERVLYGSHAPFFYPEAASLKIKEAALAADVAERILHANAARLI
jgi:predicted TIM-barrel fold metal-dependent hydrolase